MQPTEQPGGMTVEQWAGIAHRKYFQFDSEDCRINTEMNILDGDCSFHRAVAETMREMLNAYTAGLPVAFTTTTTSGIPE